IDKARLIHRKFKKIFDKYNTTLAPINKFNLEKLLVPIKKSTSQTNSISSLDLICILCATAVAGNSAGASPGSPTPKWPLHQFAGADRYDTARRASSSSAAAGVPCSSQSYPLSCRLFFIWFIYLPRGHPCTLRFNSVCVATAMTQALKSRFIPCSPPPRIVPPLASPFRLPSSQYQCSGNR
ncbi:hypothetical protein L9F63_004887, partial [Diploptera punctata]